jgi:hypothetical protein
MTHTQRVLSDWEANRLRREERWIKTPRGKGKRGLAFLNFSQVDEVAMGHPEVLEPLDETPGVLLREAFLSAA